MSGLLWDRTDSVTAIGLRDRRCGRQASGGGTAINNALFWASERLGDVW